MQIEQCIAGRDALEAVYLHAEREGGKGGEAHDLLEASSQNHLAEI